MKAAGFWRTAFAGRRRPWVALGITSMLVIFLAATVFAGGNAAKKQTWTDKLAHIGGKVLDGVTKAKSWVSDKVDKVKGFFTSDPMLKYMSQKERRQNEAARQRILKVMKSRRFRTEREKREWQKDLFDDLAKRGIVTKDPNAPGGDGGASQFWYDLEHKSGQFKKFPPGALKIDEQLKADDVDYRETSNELGQTRVRMLSKEYKRAGDATVKEVKKSTDAATGAGVAEEAIKDKVDEAEKNVQQGINIAKKVKEVAKDAGENVDDALGKNKTLKENQKNLNDLKRRRALEKAREKSADAGAGADKEKGEKAGENGPSGLNNKRARKPERDRGAGAERAKNAKNGPGRVVDEAGRKIPAGEFANGDTVVSKNGDEYEKRNGKWEKTGENYGTYKPSPEGNTERATKSAPETAPRKEMTAKEWHNKLKKNDPGAWKKVSDALKSGDPDKVDDVLRALGAKSTGGEGGGDPLRDAEEESGGAAAAGGAYKPPASSSGLPYENPNSWVPSGREATAVERSESARAADAARMGRIVAQGQSVDENIANAANQHDSAESAARGRRRRSSAMADAIVGGLTSGVAAGVDAAAGTIGAGAGNVVAGKIMPKDEGDAAGGQAEGGSSDMGADASSGNGGNADAGQAAGSKGMSVQVVGTAPPGQCKIVSGQLVPVAGYKKRIAGQTVTLSGPVSRSTVSSGSGSFSFSAVPAGNYTIAVASWDYGMTSASLKAPSGKAIRIVLKGSCPYLYVLSGDGFARENDVYSTARMRPAELFAALDDHRKTVAALQVRHLSISSIPAWLIRQKRYRDYYRIWHKPTVNKTGNYVLKLVERAGEHSFTDLVKLQAVKLGRGMQAAVTRDGRFFYYKTPLHAVDSFLHMKGRVHNHEKAHGESSSSICLYDHQHIQLHLPREAFHSGVLAVCWRGFLDGTAEGHTASAGRPWLALQRQTPGGKWRTVAYDYPRDEVTWSVFQLHGREDWDGDGNIRLEVTSCLPEKFHSLIDASWGRAVDLPVKPITLELKSARLGQARDVRSRLAASDGVSMHLGPSQEAVMEFGGQKIEATETYAFFFVAEGFYIPAPQIRVAAIP